MGRKAEHWQARALEAEAWVKRLRLQVESLQSAKDGAEARALRDGAAQIRLMEAAFRDADGTSLTAAQARIAELEGEAGEWRDRYLLADSHAKVAQAGRSETRRELDALRAEVRRLRGALVGIRAAAYASSHTARAALWNVQELADLALKDDTPQIEASENTGETPPTPEKPIAGADSRPVFPDFEPAAHVDERPDYIEIQPGWRARAGEAVSADSTITITIRGGMVSRLEQVLATAEEGLE